MVGKEPFDTRPHAQKMQKFIPNLMKIGQNSSGNDFQPHRRRVDLIGEGKRRRSPMGLEVVAIQEWEHMRSHDDVLWPIRMRYSKGSHRRTRLPETLTTPNDENEEMKRPTTDAHETTQNQRTESICLARWRAPTAIAATSHTSMASRPRGCAVCAPMKTLLTKTRTMVSVCAL